MSDNIMHMLGRLEGKVDTIVALQESQSARFDKLEERLGSLERWKGYVLGIVATVTTIVTFGWQYALKAFVQ